MNCLNKQKNFGEMKRKYNFFNSQEFDNLVPYLVWIVIYVIIMIILFSL